MKLTLGFSPCPNDTYIFDALVHGRIDAHGIEFDVRLEDVETLNELAIAGELDITKLSYHAYGHVLDKYILLNSGSALGEKCGPMLIANQAMNVEDISSATIAIPGKLTTANFLFSLEYPKATQKLAMPFDQIEAAVLSGEADAGVIIHENRFTYQERGLVKICDLGDRWEDKTGFPIPLGGIAVKRSLPQSLKNTVDALVRESVKHAFQHPADSREYVRAHAQEMSDDVMAQHIALYVNHFSEDLGETGRSAVEYMLNCASEEGLIKPVAGDLIL